MWFLYRLIRADMHVAWRCSSNLNSYFSENQGCWQMIWIYSHIFLRFILEGIFGNTLESSFHIESFFSWCFKIRNVPLWCTPCLHFLLRDLKIQRQIKAYKKIPLYIAGFQMMTWSNWDLAFTNFTTLNFDKVTLISSVAIVCLDPSSNKDRTELRLSC